MGSLQDYFKNVLFAGHEFEVSLKGAVDLARDNEDWDRLNAIVVSNIVAAQNPFLGLRSLPFHPPFSRQG